MKSCTVFAGFTLLAAASATRFTISPDQDFEADCLLHPDLGPGDECYLLDGDHFHDGLTRIHGTEDARITIRGESDNACIKGSNTQDRVLQIAHNWYTVENLCFDGHHGGDDYAATAIYVLGADTATTKDEANGLKSSVTGLQLIDLDIRNFDAECIHLRYFVTYTEITGCLVEHCGKESFVNGGGGVVGEGVYIGTAENQRSNDEAPELKLRTDGADNGDWDVSQKNWVHDNIFRTYGNECVECKEGATNNLIEHNVCEQQNDENSGCFGSRGSGNTFRYNTISTCAGAAVRVGGDDGFGTDNNIYGNIISEADHSALNLMAETLGKVCGNTISDVDIVLGGDYSNTLDPNVVGSTCSDNDTPGDIEEFGTTGASGGLPSSGDDEPSTTFTSSGDDETPAPSSGDDETPAPSSGGDETRATSSGGDYDNDEAVSSGGDFDDDGSSIGDDYDNNEAASSGGDVENDVAASSGGDDGGDDDDDSSSGDADDEAASSGEDNENDVAVLSREDNDDSSSRDDDDEAASSGEDYENDVAVLSRRDNDDSSSGDGDSDDDSF